MGHDVRCVLWLRGCARVGCCSHACPAAVIVHCGVRALKPSERVPGKASYNPRRKAVRDASNLTAEDDIDDNAADGKRASMSVMSMHTVSYSSSGAPVSPVLTMDLDDSSVPPLELPLLHERSGRPRAGTQPKLSARGERKLSLNRRPSRMIPVGQGVFLSCACACAWFHILLRAVGDESPVRSNAVPATALVPEQLWWWQAHENSILSTLIIPVPSCIVTLSLDGSFRIWNVTGDHANVSPVDSRIGSPKATGAPGSQLGSPKAPASPKHRSTPKAHGSPGSLPAAYFGLRALTTQPAGPVPIQWCSVYPGQLYRPSTWAFPGARILEGKDFEKLVAADKLLQEIRDSHGDWATADSSTDAAAYVAVTLVCSDGCLVAKLLLCVCDRTTTAALESLESKHLRHVSALKDAARAAGSVLEGTVVTMRDYRNAVERSRAFAQLFGEENWVRTQDEISKDAARAYIKKRMQERQAQIDEFMKRKYGAAVRRKKRQTKGRVASRLSASRPSLAVDQTFETLKQLTALEKKEAAEVCLVIPLGHAFDFIFLLCVRVLLFAA